MFTRVPLRLTSLTAANYRCFDSVSWNGIHPQMNVVTAVNGGGKTALLDAVAVGLAPFPRFISATRGDTIADADVARARVGQQTMRSGSDVVLGLDGELGGVATEWRVERGPGQRNQTRTGPAQPLKEFAERAWQERRQGTAALPIIAYYGTSRLWAAQRHTENRRAVEVADGYRDCLDPRVDFKSFEEWAGAVSHDRHNEASGATARANWEYLTRVLATVMQPVGLDVFEYSSADSTLLAGTSDGPLLPVGSHSDGIRTILGMVGDIVRRVCLLNGGLPDTDVAQTSGVVMVDEVDLHLHPRWQQAIAGLLQTAFPQVQWLLTTHSPQVVSTLPRECVWSIGHAEGADRLANPAEQTQGVSSGEVLAEVFDVDPMPATAWRDRLNRLDQLIEADSDERAELLREVEGHFGAGHEILRGWRLRQARRQPD